MALLGRASSLVLSTLVRLLTTLASSILAARALDPAALGVFELTQSVRLTTLLIVDIGLASAIARFVAELRGGADARRADTLAVALVWCQGVLAVLSAAVLLLLAEPLASALHQPLLLALMPVAALALGLNLVEAVLSGWLIGQQRFAVRTIVDVAGSVLTTAGIALALIEGWGVAGLLWAIALVSLARVAVFVVVQHPPTWLVSPNALGKTLARRVAVYCAGGFLVTTFDAILWQRPEAALISRFDGSREVAFFGLAVSLASLPTMLVTYAVSAALGPHLADRFGRGGLTAVRQAHDQVGRYATMIALLACVIAAGMAGSLVRVLYGDPYAETATVLRWLLIGTAASALFASRGALYFAIGRPVVRARWGFPAAGLDLALAFLLVPVLGAIGAALGKATAQLCLTAGDVAYLRRIGLDPLPFGMAARVVSACVPPGLLAFAAAEALPGAAGLSLGAVVATAVYGPALVATRALAADDLRMLRHSVGALAPRLQGYTRREVAERSP